MNETIYTEHGPIKRSVLETASRCEGLPNHLFLFASKRHAGDILGFLTLISEMLNWDAKELETFYCTYPGLRKVAAAELKRGHGFNLD